MHFEGMEGGQVAALRERRHDQTRVAPEVLEVVVDGVVHHPRVAQAPVSERATRHGLGVEPETSLPLRIGQLECSRKSRQPRQSVELVVRLQDEPARQLLGCERKPTIFLFLSPDRTHPSTLPIVRVRVRVWVRVR